MSTRVVITGVAGFIGSHLADALLDRGYAVVGIDNLLTGDVANITHLANRDFLFIEHDVTNYIYLDGPVDFVLHWASPASPIDCFSERRTSEHSIPPTGSPLISTIQSLSWHVCDQVRPPSSDHSRTRQEQWMIRPSSNSTKVELCPKGRAWMEIASSGSVMGTFDMGKIRSCGSQVTRCESGEHSYKNDS